MCFICLSNFPTHNKEPHHRLAADVGTALQPCFPDVGCNAVMRLPPGETLARAVDVCYVTLPLIATTVRFRVRVFRILFLFCLTSFLE